MICKPCQDRGRTSEATRFIATEPWCEDCFTGCSQATRKAIEKARQQAPKLAIVGKCSNCSHGITDRSKSGLCTQCSRVAANKKRRSTAIAKAVACKTSGCKGIVTRRRSHGYCTLCCNTDIQLRERLYPSQSPEKCRARASKSYYARKAIAQQQVSA